MVPASMFFYLVRRLSSFAAESRLALKISQVPERLASQLYSDRCVVLTKEACRELSV